MNTSSSKTILTHYNNLSCDILLPSDPAEDITNPAHTDIKTSDVNYWPSEDLYDLLLLTMYVQLFMLWDRLYTIIFDEFHII
jgi:hypothetical protein